MSTSKGKAEMRGKSGATAGLARGLQSRTVVHNQREHRICTLPHALQPSPRQAVLCTLLTLGVATL